MILTCDEDTKKFKVSSFHLVYWFFVLLLGGIESLRSGLSKTDAFVKVILQKMVASNIKILISKMYG